MSLDRAGRRHLRRGGRGRRAPLWCIPEGADPDKALLHFRSGGSVTASMHPDRKTAGHIAKAAGARSLVVDLRLEPEHPYPAQLDDAETVYRWLLSQGYEPRNIGSRGHSIGATLAVMLPLRLLAKGEATPGAVVTSARSAGQLFGMFMLRCGAWSEDRIRVIYRTSSGR